MQQKLYVVTKEEAKFIKNKDYDKLNWDTIQVIGSWQNNHTLHYVYNKSKGTPGVIPGIHHEIMSKSFINKLEQHCIKDKDNNMVCNEVLDTTIVACNLAKEALANNLEIAYTYWA